MQEHNSDPGQSTRPVQPSRPQPAGGNESRRAARMTPARAIGAVVVLALLISALLFSLFGTAKVSYARSNNPVVPLDTPTATATATAPPTPTPSPTTAPTPSPTPTQVPTQPPRKTPTPVPTVPPPVVATATAMATPTASPTATSTVSAGSPTPGVTATTGVPVSPGKNNGTSTPTKTGGGGANVMLVVFGTLLLLFCLGLGWWMFRRMLLPQAEVKLPPSGARPWSRTRAPNPDSLSGVRAANANMKQFNQNAALAFNASANMNNAVSQHNGVAPNMQGQGFEVPQQSFPGPASNGQAALNNGHPGFSDGFIPPTPQIFPQSEASMIPNGSGAFPVINNTNGFAPASSAFNAMYGLPGDPFSSSQTSAAPWLDTAGNGNGNGNGNGAGAPRSSSSTSFAPVGPDPNSPQVAEVMRKYSQKGQPAQPPQKGNGPQAGFQNPGWLQ